MRVCVGEMDSDGVSEGVIGSDIVIEVSVMVGPCDQVTDCGCVIVGVGVRVVGCVGVGSFVLPWVVESAGTCG
jgi:hypothetical protein